MAEPNDPVAVIPARPAALPGLQRSLAEIGPVWPCARAEDLGALVAERRIRLILAAPRDPRGTLVTGALAAVARQQPGIKSVLLYPASQPELVDARVVAESGACVAYLLDPPTDLARTIRTILSPRWQRGPEHILIRGLIRPLVGAAKPFGILSVLRPWAPAKVREICALAGLHERRVQRDFARSLPRGGLIGPMTPHRFARLALSLTVAWWLARGRSADRLVVQFGFPHRYALAEQLKKYVGRPPGGFTRPRHFREAYSSVLRKFLLP
jgi:hypothetical protein